MGVLSSYPDHISNHINPQESYTENVSFKLFYNVNLNVKNLGGRGIVIAIIYPPPPLSQNKSIDDIYCLETPTKCVFHSDV